MKGSLCLPCVFPLALEYDQRGIGLQPGLSSFAGGNKGHFGCRIGEGVDQAEPLRLQPSVTKGSEDLGQSLREVNDVENAAMAEKQGSGSGKVGEGKGNLLAGQCALWLRGYAACPRRAEGGIGDYPAKTPRREKVGNAPGVSQDDGTALFKAVAHYVLAGAAEESGLEFHAPEGEGLPAPGKQEGDDAAACAEVNNFFSQAGLDKVGEEKGIDTVAIPLCRLGDTETTYLFNSFFAVSFGSVLSGGGSGSHSPAQYLPGSGGDPLSASGGECR